MRRIGKRFRGRETYSSFRAKSPSQTVRASATEREVHKQNAFQTKMWHSNLEKFRRELIFDADKRGVSEGFG